MAMGKGTCGVSKRGSAILLCLPEKYKIYAWERPPKPIENSHHPREGWPVMGVMIGIMARGRDPSRAVGMTALSGLVMGMDVSFHWFYTAAGHDGRIWPFRLIEFVFQSIEKLLKTNRCI